MLPFQYENCFSNNSSSVKIVHVITGLNNGGAESVLYRLCSNGLSANCEHFVISLTGRGVYADRLEDIGVTVQCLNMPRGRITLSGLFMLFKLLLKNRDAVVQTWMYHSDFIGGIVARLTGNKSIVWGLRNSNLAPEFTCLSTRLVARLCALLSRWIPVRIVSCSKQAAETHQALGYMGSKFTIIPNGFVLEKLRNSSLLRTKLRTDFGLQEDIPVLGMVARYDPLKDHSNLLRSLNLLKKRNSSFICLLIGFGIDNANIQLVEMIRRYNLDDVVRLIGPRNDIPAVMNAIDLHILSSVGEAFPNVLAESMACGTPCVTTDVGDAAFIVDSTGWIVPAQNSTALFDAINQALDERVENLVAWKNRKMACRKRIEDYFSMRKMLDAYYCVWCEANLIGR